MGTTRLAGTTSCRESAALRVCTLEALQQFEPLAWNALVEAYSSGLANRYRRKRIQDADAADLMQEVFLAVFRNIRAFKPNDADPQSLEHWVSRIATSKASDYWRWSKSESRDRNAPRFLEAACEQQRQAQEERALSTALAAALTAIRAEVRERTWNAFWQVVVDQRAARDVATELEMTVHAVQLARLRVLRRLREELPPPRAQKLGTRRDNH
jgi:RNA polymerase sigma-70 factor (ECF subfamily)